MRPAPGCSHVKFRMAVKMMRTAATASFEPSRMYLYAREREVEAPNGGGRLVGSNSELMDVGADVQDGLDWAMRIGICPEKLWPYDLSLVNVSPPHSTDVAAMENKIRMVIG